MPELKNATRFGIVARYQSRCGLCGAEVTPGTRIFQLPDSRRGDNQQPWVCRSCRYPDPSRDVDLVQILTKIEYRMAVGKPLSLNLQECAVLAEEIRARGVQPRPVSTETPFATLDEALHQIERCLALRQAPNVGHAMGLTILLGLATSDSSHDSTGGSNG